MDTWNWYVLMLKNNVANHWYRPTCHMSMPCPFPQSAMSNPRGMWSMSSACPILLHVRSSVSWLFSEYWCIIDHMHMTSQKGAPVVLGVKRVTPRAPSPSMQSEGKPLHASPPSWPGCAHWLRGVSANALCQQNMCAQRDKSWPPAWRRCYGDVTSMHKVYRQLTKSISSAYVLPYLLAVKNTSTWQFITMSHVACLVPLHNPPCQVLELGKNVLYISRPCSPLVGISGGIVIPPDDGWDSGLDSLSVLNHCEGRVV